MNRRLRWLDGVSSWRLDREGRIHVGDRDRLLVMDETASGADPLTGTRGALLAARLGIDDELYEDLIDRMGLVYGRGPFHVKRGREAAAGLRIEAGRIVLLGGTGRVFGLPRAFERGRVHGAPAIHLPALGARWWSVEKNTTEADRVLSRWIRWALD